MKLSFVGYVDSAAAVVVVVAVAANDVIVLTVVTPADFAEQDGGEWVGLMGGFDEWFEIGHADGDVEENYKSLNDSMSS